MTTESRDAIGWILASVTRDQRDTATWILTSLVTVSVLIGLAVKLVLMPYLREHLIAPMAQVKKQVTENHHENDEPTLPDRIEDVGKDVHRARDDVRALARVFDQHLNFSDRWTDLIEREIEMIKEEIHKHHPTHRSIEVKPQEGPKDEKDS